MLPFTHGFGQVGEFQRLLRRTKLPEQLPIMFPRDAQRRCPSAVGGIGKKSRMNFPPAPHPHEKAVVMLLGLVNSTDSFHGRGCSLITRPYSKGLSPAILNDAENFSVNYFKPGFIT